MSDWKSALANLNLPDPPATDDNTSPLVEPETPAPAPRPTLDIIFERKGRAGKQATIITGFTCSDDELLDIAATIKKRLGTGGSARGGEILIQGDRRTDIHRLLISLGYRARII